MFAQRVQAARAGPGVQGPPAGRVRTERRGAHTEWNGCRSGVMHWPGPDVTDETELHRGERRVSERSERTSNRCALRQVPAEGIGARA
ncbi:hypothetical protein GCM10010495_50180 [Kitasatospora herbaricolor]|nr:hypothetical protein GCM10010495_50180 [Kitasatospora herbaricolor]